MTDKRLCSSTGPGHRQSDGGICPWQCELAGAERRACERHVAGALMHRFTRRAAWPCSRHPLTQTWPSCRPTRSEPIGLESRPPANTSRTCPSGWEPMPSVSRRAPSSRSPAATPIAERAEQRAAVPSHPQRPCWKAGPVAEGFSLRSPMAQNLMRLVNDVTRLLTPPRSASAWARTKTQPGGGALLAKYHRPNQRVDHGHLGRLADQGCRPVSRHRAARFVGSYPETLASTPPTRAVYRWPDRLPGHSGPSGSGNHPPLPRHGGNGPISNAP